MQAQGGIKSFFKATGVTKSSTIQPKPRSNEPVPSPVRASTRVKNASVSPYKESPVKSKKGAEKTHQEVPPTSKRSSQRKGSPDVEMIEVKSPTKFTMQKVSMSKKDAVAIIEEEEPIVRRKSKSKTKATVLIDSEDDAPKKNNLKRNKPDSSS